MTGRTVTGQPCVFEKPEKKNGELISTASVHVPLSSAFLFSHLFFLSHRQMV
jgi:hypothetical protein